MSDLIHPRVLDLAERDRGIFETFNLSLLEAREGRCVLEGRVPESLVNAAGYAHGGFTYSLMDTACAYALASHAIRGVTINGSVNYIRGGSADSRFVATVVLANAGRRVATLECRVEVEHESQMKLAGLGTFVFQVLEAPATG